MNKLIADRANMGLRRKRLGSRREAEDYLKMRWQATYAVEEDTWYFADGSSARLAQTYDLQAKQYENKFSLVVIVP